MDDGEKSIPKKGIVESAFNSNVPMHVIECEFKDVDEVEVESKFEVKVAAEDKE